MASKMEHLQSTANDIGSVAGRSLENQAQLLDGQAMALQGLNDLYSFQAQALQESRDAMQKLAHFGQQQQELLSRQEQIRDAHSHLMQNSESILEAQEEYRTKQANIFAAVDKLYVLRSVFLAAAVQTLHFIFTYKDDDASCCRH